MLYKYVKGDVVSLSSKTRQKKDFALKKDFISFLSVTFCFLIGGILLIYSLYPYFRNYISFNESTSNFSKSLLTPSPSQNLTAGANLSSSNLNTNNYIDNVSKNFSSTNKLLSINQRTFPEYSHITGEMKLSIPKLKLKNLPVKINVNSFDPNDYLPTLEKNLGHFQGTSLPDKPGNTFIYGHSANELWAKADPTNPKIAFTFLDKIEIGDEILLNFNGVEYKYLMQKAKLVSANDITPIYTTSDEKILTLMTCWSPGIGTERLIVTAKQV